MGRTAREKIFESDVLSKRERVERTLNHQPVDRVALHDQVSYNPGVIAAYTGRRVDGFDYGIENICAVIRKTLDACFPPRAPVGTDRVVTEDGFVRQNDNWTTWRVSRPFDDVPGARECLLRRTARLRRATFDAGQARQGYHAAMTRLQGLVGETVIVDTSSAVGLCSSYDDIGLELYSYLYADHPDVVAEYIETYTTNEIQRVHAIADPELSPVILIADDFASKRGPIFSPTFLSREHFPRLKRLVAAWHDHGMTVIYHSDGNWKQVIPDLIACGVDGFYCLEPGNGMEIVELKNTWPDVVWMGGVDGVDLMERGTPEAVRREVHRHIRETDALRAGGMFVGSSSEINPPIKPENFRAMVDAVGEVLNPDLSPKATR